MSDPLEFIETTIDIEEEFESMNPVLHDDDDDHLYQSNNNSHHSSVSDDGYDDDDDYVEDPHAMIKIQILLFKGMTQQLWQDAEDIEVDVKLAKSVMKQLFTNTELQAEFLKLLDEIKNNNCSALSQ